MASTNQQQREISERLDVATGDLVLEVGHGPGVLIGILAAESRAALIAGADPSPEMREAARRANRAAIREGRVDIREGTAGRLPYDDGTFDRVVAVNNCHGWPDLPTGLREVRRVLRPGGSVLLALHSRNSPKRVQQRLGLSEDRLEVLRRAMQDAFGEVSREDLTYSVAFSAARAS